MHMKAVHPGQLPPEPVGTRVKRTRQSFSNAQKDAAITRSMELESSGHHAPKQQTAKEMFGKTWEGRKNYIGRWLKKPTQIRLMCALGAKFASRQKDGAGRAADFPDAEDELYLRVLRRRIDHGYPVNHWWLKMEFRAILNETTPPGHNNFKCSSGWAVRFCVRYRLSLQAANNIKAHDQVDRVEAIRSFHRYWLHKVQNSQPQSDPKYGRFPAKRILHVDQVPLPFASAQKKTLNPINFGSCRIAGPNMSGLEKRQATLQLWIVADAEHQYVKPSLIFRGSTGPKSKLPWPEEKALYDTLPDIRVYFQKNAWADEEFASTVTTFSMWLATMTY